ncbi:hypothetical protein MPTK2_3g12870 [Marchantia polymorpha subsp. ruderalis]
MTPMWEFRTRQGSIELVTLVLMGEAGFSKLDAYVLNKGDVDYIYSTGVQSEGEREKCCCSEAQTIGNPFTNNQFTWIKMSGHLSRSLWIQYDIRRILTES